MKKISTHIYIAIGFFVLTFILGSFFDLQLSQAIASRNNTFGLVLSVIGTTPGYGCLAVIGGGFLALGLKEKEKIWLKVIYFITVLVFYGLAVFFAGREFFGPNGFTGAAGVWVGYLIELPVMAGLAYLGYRIGRKSDNPRLWLVLAILSLGILLALVPGVTLIKSIFHRPRFRMITGVDIEGLVDFHPWWVPCKDYKHIMAIYNEYHPEALMTSEEFKSFPSGHAGACAVIMMSSIILPAINIDFKKYQIPVFYIGFAWTLLIAFARILVGAHFLSDVSMGALLSLIFGLIVYFVIFKSKLIFKEQENETQNI